MRTEFAEALRDDPDFAQSESIIRRCVHCGLCTATCPTYLLLGDELDSPRGRIYLIKNMLEGGRPADEKTVRHIDRCLSCLACTTTCPSGVDYMHLVDHAREHIERTYRRPAPDRLLRALLLRVLPNPRWFRWLARIGSLLRPLSTLAPGPLGALLDAAPRQVHPPAREQLPGVFAPTCQRKQRVLLLSGCVQPALAPQINAATIRFLNRRGCEVVIAKGGGCCGALAHHLGDRNRARRAAAANIRAWNTILEEGDIDAVLVNASGCGTMVKDYGHLFRNDPDLAEDAKRVSGLARDIAEHIAADGLEGAKAPEPLRVAYQSSCSLQHGQRVHDAPVALLRKAGFEVVEPDEGHICCGSAGTYSLLQPTLARQLRSRKAKHLDALRPDAIATANVGCLKQLENATTAPIVHTVELLDWASGGPRPPALDGDRPRD